MANTRRHIDEAVDEVLDVRDAAEGVIRGIDRALADGIVTREEIEAIADQARRVVQEAKEAVQATERANVAELVMASMLRRGDVSPRLLRRARDVGLSVVVPFVEVAPCPMDQKKTA